MGARWGGGRSRATGCWGGSARKWRSNCRWRCFFFQAEDGIRDLTVTGVQTCALPIYGIAIRAGDMASLPLLQRFGVKRAARVSLYVYNTLEEIDEFARKLGLIVGES